LAHKKHKRKFLNILLIPDDESSPKSLKIRYSLLTLIVIALTALFISILFGIFTYGKLVQKAYENLSLRDENQQLTNQLQRVNELSSEIEELRNYGKKVQKSMLGYVNVSENIQRSGEESNSDIISDQSIISMFTSIPVMEPITGFISQEFTKGVHNGVDIVAPLGTPIVASGDGKILFAGWTIDGGNTIVIGHSNGYYSFYKHNLRNLVYENQIVNQGDVIAYLGNSGEKSFGPHLHFEIWKDGESIDPNILVTDLTQ
jgi:murein DD-endopeptidase MepM/ murein hydrolase activator NlpD